MSSCCCAPYSSSQLSFPPLFLTLSAISLIYTVSYKPEAPLWLRAVFYVPQDPPMKFGDKREVDRDRHKDQILKLLRFDSSMDESLVNLEEYVERCPDQKYIYYLKSPSRATAMASPYMERFLQNNIPVLLMYDDIDDFVAMHVPDFKGKRLMSLFASDITDDDFKNLEKTSMGDEMTDALGSGNQETLKEYFKAVLGSKVSTVKFAPKGHLTTSPALVTDFPSEAVRKMMKTYNQEMALKDMPVALVLNASHEINKNLFKLQKTNPSVAQLIVEQVYDNACIAAGVVDDPRLMLDRLTSLVTEMTSRFVSHSSAASTCDEEVSGRRQSQGTVDAEEVSGAEWRYASLGQQFEADGLQEEMFGGKPPPGGPSMEDVTTSSKEAGDNGPPPFPDDDTLRAKEEAKEAGKMKM
eukprot:GHVN01035328.1.p1 GENE.GHVN01035328.1~~GHVN01035328.1.p1  ORF type:complete len:411 (-),score=77.87 GHVN01035328.1:3-1235(-)